MDEIKTIIIRGFSSTFSPYYSDELIINCDGKIDYNGMINGVKYEWHFESNSEGFHLIFSSVLLEIYNSNMRQVVEDDSKDGYKIELITTLDDHFMYTFYGLMEENDQSGLRNTLSEFIPIFEELPLYMESESISLDEYNVLES